jgi:hypothetical protein
MHLDEEVIPIFHVGDAAAIAARHQSQGFRRPIS